MGPPRIVTGRAAQRPIAFAPEAGGSTCEVACSLSELQRRPTWALQWAARHVALAMDRRPGLRALTHHAMPAARPPLVAPPPPRFDDGGDGGSGRGSGRAALENAYLMQAGLYAGRSVLWAAAGAAVKLHFVAKHLRSSLLGADGLSR